MGLHRLLFDSAAPDESANVGAYLRASDGTLLTHTTTGPIEALDVQIANASIAVTATNLDIRDLVFATDKVDVSGSSVSITGTVGVTQSTSPWVVSATNLDIRDLTAVSDSVQAWAFDGAGTALTSTLNAGKQSLDVNVTSAISVDLDGVYALVTNLNPDNVGIIAHTRAAVPGAAEQIQRTTAAAPTANGVVAANVHGLDVNGFLMGFNGTTYDRLTSTSSALDVNLKTSAISLTVSDIDNTAMSTESDSITTTSGTAITSVLANRKDVKLYNNGSKIIYVGPSGVSTASGFPLPPGSILEARIGAAVAIHAVAQSGTQDLRVMQNS